VWRGWHGGQRRGLVGVKGKLCCMEYVIAESAVVVGLDMNASAARVVLLQSLPGSRIPG